MGRLALIYWLLLEHCYHTATIWQRPWEERRSRTNSPHCDCLSDEPKSRRFEDIPWAVASGDHSTFRRDYTKRPSMSWSLSEICSGTVLDSCGTGGAGRASSVARRRHQYGELPAVCPQETVTGARCSRCTAGARSRASRKYQG